MLFLGSAHHWWGSPPVHFPLSRPFNFPVIPQEIIRAHFERSLIPQLCTFLRGKHVFIFAFWNDPASSHMTIEDFVRDGRRYIPLFYDEAEFNQEASGSGHEHKGVAITTELLANILHSDELLILNPNSNTPVELSKSDLQH